MHDRGYAAVAQYFDGEGQPARRPEVLRQQLDESEIGATFEHECELGPPARTESEPQRRSRHPPHPPQPPPPPPPPHDPPPPPPSDDPELRLTKPWCIHANSLVASTCGPNRATAKS